MFKFTKEVLEEAVKQSSSYAEVLRVIGGSPRSFSHIKFKIQKYGFDIKHFKYDSKYSKEQLQEAVLNSKSYADVARIIGLAPIGGNTCNLRDLIQKFSINVDHFLGRAHGRGKISKNRRTPEDILKVYPAGHHRIEAHLLRRALLEIGVEEKCIECKQGNIWRNKPLRLPVDHIDGDYLNCSKENLRFMCPNCHTQTETWGNKSRDVLQ